MKRFMLLSYPLSICWSDASLGYMVEDNSFASHAEGEPLLGTFNEFDEAMQLVLELKEDKDGSRTVFIVCDNPYCGD